jgi:hypothetical protein
MLMRPLSTAISWRHTGFINSQNRQRWRRAHELKLWAEGLGSFGREASSFSVKRSFTQMNEVSFKRRRSGIRQIVVQ